MSTSATRGSNEKNFSKGISMQEQDDPKKLDVIRTVARKVFDRGLIKEITPEILEEEAAGKLSIPLSSEDSTAIMEEVGDLDKIVKDGAQ